MDDAIVPVVIAASGPPRLASPQGHNRTQVIITSPLHEFVKVRRHHEKGSNGTSSCRCEPPCSTSRLDYFSCGLELIGTKQWELVALKFGETPLRTMEVECLRKGMKFETEGLWLTWWRIGDPINGRVQVSVSSVVKTPFAKFDLAWAVSKATRISTTFFGRYGDSAQERGVASAPNNGPAGPYGEAPVATPCGQLPQAKYSASGKPIVPKGRKP